MTATAQTVAEPASAPPADLPVWDLSDLYAGRDDPRIQSDIADAREANVALLKLKGAIVGARATPERLGLILDEAASLYERALNRLWSVGAYAGLSSAVAQGDPNIAKFEADVRAQGAAIAADSVFLTLEINQLEPWEIEAALRARPEAARWRPWLRRISAGRDHELSAEMEKLLVDRAPAVVGWSRLFDETLARMRATVDGEQLTLNQALNRLSDPDGARRKAAAEGLAEALAGVAPVQALALNTLALEKQVEDRWRRYPDPAASRHLSNEVHAESVQALEAAVVDAYPRLSHRWYAIKARLLGKEALDYWDRNAPIVSDAPRRFDWREAQSVVLDSFNRLSPRAAELAGRFFAKPWIDAAPRPGKASGAFAHPVTSEKHPYVLMNFMGERRDVLTLAHELGHAVHQTLAAPNGTVLADTPLTLAETASIFAEGLTFERLLQDAEPAERRVLLAGKIEDGLNTVVRQIAFHRFETRFHAARAQGEVSSPAIGQLWREVMGESLGPAITLNPGFEHYWAYVGHFVHSPFYVYAYAFGDLLVSALMDKRREDPAAFTPLYEALLAAGGTKTYVEALQPFGLDPRDGAFWARGCARLESLIDQFEALD